MDLNKLPFPAAWFSVRVIAVVIVMLAVGLTLWAPKDDNSDAWSYHYYAGSMLLDGRKDLDYFGASLQGYLNPLVHVPFTAMVKAHWADKTIAVVMAIFSSLALCLVVLFYRTVLGLQRWELVGAAIMSIAGLITWTCVGTSVPDLFLQIPVMLSLLCFFTAYKKNPVYYLFLAGFFGGVALGLKLTVVFFVPAFGVLLLSGVISRQFDWWSLLLYGVGGLIGFLLAYGWWGYELYREFKNPFFPFFNNWFESQDFPSESTSSYRFLSWNWLEQAMLPFRMALSDAFIYIEMREPDLRPSIFLFSMLGLLVKTCVSKNKNSCLLYVERNFLWFLIVTLYVWVFMSGNGRYAVGILVLLGGGILVGLRAVLPFKWFRTVFFLALLLQVFITGQLLVQDSAIFRFSKGQWSGSWFDADFSRLLGKGNQLILVGNSSSYSAMVKDMGVNSSIVTVRGVFPLENSEKIQKKIFQYDGNILGMFPASKEFLQNKDWIEKVYFNEFSRFGLALKDYRLCQVVDKGRVIEGVPNAGFMFCPLVRNDDVLARYEEIVVDAKRYFQRIEALCPDLFSPKSSVVNLTESSKEKFYGNYEIWVYMKSPELVLAKKAWSMMIFPLGGIKEMDALSSEQWRVKYCEPLRKSKAMSRT